MDKWKVVTDGCSNPMLQSPAGRLIRIQGFEHGQWLQTHTNNIDMEFFAEAANELLLKRAAQFPRRE